MSYPVKIPDNYYMGCRQDGLAFIVPDGTDKAADRRKETVNHWAKQIPFEFIPAKNPRWEGQRERRNTGPDTSTYKSFPNTPVAGFKLYGQTSRWSTSNQVFEIEDPRGFRIQIYAGNMFNICQAAGIKNGIFQGEFVYGREGQKNVLLPVGSDIYKAAKEHTDDTNSPMVSLKQLERGDEVILLYKGHRQQCAYMGLQWHISTRGVTKQQRNYSYFGTHQTPQDTTWTDIIGPPRHIFFNLNAQTSYYQIIDPVKPNVLKVVKKKAFTSQKLTGLLKKHNGALKIPFTPNTWSIEHGYHSEPDMVYGHSLDREFLVQLRASRIDYLADFVNEYIQGEPRHGKR